MREGDDLYFAPELRFSAVDLDSPVLADQLQQRIDGFYLRPARLCVEHGHAFAAGLILVSTIDFMAGFHHVPGVPDARNVGRDFRAFVRSELRSFKRGDMAQILYDAFRSGLTHECRVKDGGEFSFDWPQTLRLQWGRPCINPQLLLLEVQAALEGSMAALRADADRRRAAAARLRADFAIEFGIVERAAAG
jgi:hypothetical protein